MTALKKAELETLLADAVRLDNRMARSQAIASMSIDAIAAYLEECGYIHVGEHPGDPSMTYWECEDLGRVTLWPQDPAACLESMAKQRGLTTLRVVLDILHGETIPSLKKWNP